MDVLSDAIGAMRMGRPHSTEIRKRAPWSVRAEPFSGAAFHVVLKGTCWLIPPEGGAIALGVGDVVCVPHGCGHALADSPATPLQGALSASLANLGPNADTDAGSNADLDADAGLSADTATAGLSADTDAAEPRANTATGLSADTDAKPGAGTNAGPGADADTGPGAGDGATTVLLCGAYTLDQARPHPLFAELPEVIHLPARLGHRSPLLAAVNLLGGEVAHPEHGTEAVVAALLDMMLLYILRAWLAEQAEGGPATGWAATLSDPVVTTALRHIHREPEAQWTVQTLGAKAGLSRAAFSRRFTALVGKPPLGYLTWWRMTLAARLLRDSDKPLQTVAQRAGYASEFAFAKAFKREHGVAPGQYRRQARR